MRTTFDESETSDARRGMRACHRCHRRSLKRIDGRKLEVESARGSVDGVRTFECTTPGCGVLVRQALIWVGETGVSSLRRNGPEDLVKVEILPAILIVKA